MNLKAFVKDLLIKEKVRFDRGNGYAGFIKTFVLMAIGLKVYDISFILVIPIMISYVLLMWFIGYFDQIYGIWLQQSEWCTIELNPVSRRMDERIEAIYREVVHA